MAPLDTQRGRNKDPLNSLPWNRAVDLFCILSFFATLTTQSGATRVRCQANVADILALNLPRIWEFS